MGDILTMVVSKSSMTTNEEIKKINYKLTKEIKDKIAAGESMCNIISDILEFEEMDVYDILDQIPESLISKIRKELAEKNFKIAEKEFPGLKNELLDESAFED